MAKRAAAGTLALAVCLSGGALALAGAAQADSGFSFDSSNRVAGDDRYATAALASKKAFPTTNDDVVIVNGENAHVVDGLTASYLAGIKHAPILYTKATSTPSATTAELARLKAKNVWIVGGKTAVSQGLEDGWAEDHTVTRFGGTDRYETATKVATSDKSVVPGKVFVANGEQGHTADALAVGGLAYAKHYPIVLVQHNHVPGVSASYLASVKTNEHIVIGGSVVVDDSTYGDVEGSDRLSGNTREGTATKVAKFATEKEGFTTKDLILVGSSDANAADSLVAAPFAGEHKIPLLFIKSDTPTQSVSDYLTGNAASLTGTGYVFGGVNAVSDTAVKAAEKLAGGTGTVTSNQSFKVDATDAKSWTGDHDTSLTTDATQTDKNARTYSVNVGDAASVKIALVDPGVVHVSTSGGVTFDKLGSVATLTSASGITINQINGAAVSPTTASASNVIPKDGVVTFRVNGNNHSYGTAIPVIFKANANGDLAVDANGAPTVAYGVGGQSTVIPVDATTGAAVATVQAAGNNWYVATSGGSASVYRFTSTDTFKAGATILTQAQFVADLTKGAVIDTAASGAYSPTGARTFVLTTVIPGVPTVGTAATVDSTNSGSDPDKVKVTWTNPNNIGIASYQVQYAVVASDGTLGTWAADTTASSWTAPSGTAAAGGAGSVLVNLPPAGKTYVWRVAAVGLNGGQLEKPFSAATNSVATPASATALNTLAPTGNLAIGGSGSLKVGDTITIPFAQPVASTGSAKLTLINSAGKSIDLVEGSSTATFAYGTGNLVVTVKAAPSAAFDLTGTVQIAALSGVTNSADASQGVNLHATTDAKFTTWASSGAPAVVAKPTAVSASASSGTVTATVASGNVVHVYDATGTKLLGTSPASTGSAVTFAVSGLAKNQNIVVVAADSTTGMESIGSGAVTAHAAVSATATVGNMLFTAAPGAAGNGYTVVVAQDATPASTFASGALSVTYTSGTSKVSDVATSAGSASTSSIAVTAVMPAIAASLASGIQGTPLSFTGGQDALASTVSAVSVGA